MIKKIEFPIQRGQSGDHWEIMRILNEIADHLNQEEHILNMEEEHEYWNKCQRGGD